MSAYFNTQKQRGFRDFIPQQSGKGRICSVSSISRQLIKAHYDGYHPRMSRQLATALKRPKYERRTPEFVEEIRKKILCLHEYNLQIAKVKFKYPRSEQLDVVLMQYVELECGLLYETYTDVDKERENQVTQRVLRLLRVILHDALQNGDVSLKTTIQACDKALLKLFVNVRADYVSENKLVASTITKLLDKLSLLDDVNKLKGKNIAFQEDTFLRHPLVSSLRQNLATSDYESDGDEDDDDDLMPMINENVSNSLPSPQGLFSHLEEKVNILRTSKNFDNLSFKFGSKDNNFSSLLSNQRVQKENFGTTYQNKQRFIDKNENLRKSDHSIDRSTENRVVGMSEKTTNRSNSVQEDTVNFLHVDCEANAQRKSNNFLTTSSNTLFLKQSNKLNKPSVPAKQSSERIFLATENVTKSSFSKNNESQNNLRQVNGTKTNENNRYSNGSLSKVTHNVEEVTSSFMIAEDVREKQNEIQKEIFTASIEEPVKTQTAALNSTVKPTSIDKNIDENSLSLPSEECEIIELDEDSSDVPTFSRDVASKIKSEVPSSSNASEECCSLYAVPPTVPSSGCFTPSAELYQNNSFNNKTQAREPVNGGIITIEILDDDDDYIGLNSNVTEGLPQYGTSSSNLLQSTEIKQEENEENRSPNFSIPSSDNDDQNFWGSSKGARNSNSSGLNKLGKGTNKDSAKEADPSAILISDSEDEVLDAPSACNEELLNNNSRNELNEDEKDDEGIRINTTPPIEGEKENDDQIEEVHKQAAILPSHDLEERMEQSLQPNVAESAMSELDSEKKNEDRIEEVRRENFYSPEPILHSHELEEHVEQSAHPNVAESALSHEDGEKNNEDRIEEVCSKNMGGQQPVLHRHTNLTKSATLSEAEIDQEVSNEEEIETNNGISVEGTNEDVIEENAVAEIINASVHDKENIFCELESKVNKTSSHVDTADEDVTHETELTVIVDNENTCVEISTEEIQDIGEDLTKSVDQNQTIPIPQTKEKEEDALETEVPTEALTSDSSGVSSAELNQTVPEPDCDNVQFHNELSKITPLEKDFTTSEQSDIVDSETPIVPPESSTMFLQVEKAPESVIEQIVESVNEISEASKVHENEILHVSEITIHQESQEGESETQNAHDHQKMEMNEEESVFLVGEVKESEIRNPDQCEIEITEKQNLSVVCTDNETGELQIDHSDQNQIIEEANSDETYKSSDDLPVEVTCEIPESTCDIRSDNSDEHTTVTNEFSQSIENQVTTCVEINDKEENHCVSEEPTCELSIEDSTEPVREEKELQEPESVPCDSSDSTCQEIPINQDQSNCAIEVTLENQMEVVGTNVESTTEEIKKTSITENVDTDKKTRESPISENIDTSEERKKSSMSENVDTALETKESPISENVDTTEETMESPISENVDTVEETHEFSVSTNVDAVDEIKESLISEDVSSLQGPNGEPQKNLTSDVPQDNSKCVQDVTYEAIDYSVNAQCPPQPSDNVGYVIQPPHEDNQHQHIQNNLPIYNTDHQSVLNLQTQASNNESDTQNTESSLSQKVESENSHLALYSLPSALTEVEYNEYNAQKKVGGDLELLANIAADQETLAVKTDSEKEIADTASDLEILTKLNLTPVTPRRRKSKVKFDTKKKTLPRETLPRAVKGSQRRNLSKQKSNAEETENKRVTRNMGSKAKSDVNVLKEVQKQPRLNRNEDSKYKPHDFISLENSILPARTNNVYAQKRLMETNTTSEDSNDSCESTLFIDLGESLKHADKTIKSVYEEDTICDMLEFITTEDKTTVCISIPENEVNCADSFHILKQMEAFVGNNNKETTESIPKIQVDVEEQNKASSHTCEEPNSEANQDSRKADEDLNFENSLSNEGADETKIVKTTDHSIENILNKIPSNGEVKAALHSCRDEIEFQDDVVTLGSIEKEQLPTQKPPKESEKQKVDNNLKSKASKINEDLSQHYNIPTIEVVVCKVRKSEDKKTRENRKIGGKTKKRKEENHIQVVPEDLTVDKTDLSAAKVDDSGEKIFKTKAAVKSYEDKLQPNPVVVLRKCELKHTEPQEELGMRTRLRAKSTEVQRITRFDRSRSSSVDFNALSSSSESCHNQSTDTSGFNESTDSIEVTASTDSALTTKVTPIQESQEISILPNLVDEKEELSNKTELQVSDNPPKMEPNVLSPQDLSIKAEVPINDDPQAIAPSISSTAVDEKENLSDKLESSSDTSTLQPIISSENTDEKENLLNKVELPINDDTSSVHSHVSSKHIDEQENLSNEVKLLEKDDISVLESKHDDEKEIVSNKVELTFDNDISLFKSVILSKHDQMKNISPKIELPVDTPTLKSSISSEHVERRESSLESPVTDDNSLVSISQVTSDVSAQVDDKEKESNERQSQTHLIAQEEVTIQNDHPQVTNAAEDLSLSVKNDDNFNSSMDIVSEITVRTEPESIVEDRDTIQKKKDIRQNNESNNVPAKKLISKKNTDRSPPKSKTLDGVKGRSLENTIKKMKEKIEESEKAKKDSSIPKFIEKSCLLQSNEVQELKSKDKTPKDGELEKTKERHSLSSSTDFEKPDSLQNKPDKGNNQQTNEGQIDKGKSEIEKKSHKNSVSEDSKQKFTDLHRNDTKRKRSRSPSKSRSSDKKTDSGAKEKSSHKSSRSRSSSKSRPLDKRSKHHSDGEIDRKRRSKSKSLDKDRNLTQEDPNGHKKRRSISPSKSKSSDGKTKHVSSERSSSKHKNSESKEKFSHIDDKKDHHKKSNSKSPPKPKSLDDKQKQTLSEKTKNEEKDKSKDKKEEPKNKSDLSRSENKSNLKIDEINDKLKRNNVETDKEPKSTNDKVERKTSKSKSTRHSSRKIDHGKKVEDNVSEKHAEKHKPQNSVKRIDEVQIVNEKDKHQGSDKPKSKERSQETNEKSTHADRHKKDDHSKNSDKSRRSHSKEKIKMEGTSRTNKREKGHREKQKDDKKPSERSGDVQELDSKRKGKENDKIVTEERKQKNHEDETKSSQKNDYPVIEDNKNKPEIIGTNTSSSLLNHQNDSSVVDISKSKQEKGTKIGFNTTSSLPIDKRPIKTPRIDIPKKRKYEILYEENGNFLVKEKKLDGLPEAKIAKTDETVVNTKKSTLHEKPTQQIEHTKVSEVVTASVVTSNEEPSVAVEEIRKPATPMPIIYDRTPLQNALDMSTTDILYENFASGIKIDSASIQAKDDENMTVPSLDKQKDKKGNTVIVCETREKVFAVDKNLSPRHTEEVITSEVQSISKTLTDIPTVNDFSPAIQTEEVAFSEIESISKPLTDMSMVNKDVPPVMDTEEVISCEIQDISETLTDIPTVNKDFAPAEHAEEVNFSEIQSITETVTDIPTINKDFLAVEPTEGVTSCEMQRISATAADIPADNKDFPPAVLPLEITSCEMQSISALVTDIPAVNKDFSPAILAEEVTSCEMESISTTVKDIVDVNKDFSSAILSEEVTSGGIQNVSETVMDIPAVSKDLPPAILTEEVTSCEMESVSATVTDIPAVKDLPPAILTEEVTSCGMQSISDNFKVSTDNEEFPTSAPTEVVASRKIPSISETPADIPTVKDFPTAVPTEEVTSCEIQSISKTRTDVPTVSKELFPAIHTKEKNSIGVQSVNKTEIQTVDKDLSPAAHTQDINSVGTRSDFIKIPSVGKHLSAAAHTEELNSSKGQICGSKSHETDSSQTQFKEKPECPSPVKLLLQSDVPLSMSEPVFVNSVFSSSQNINVRVLATPIDSTVKHLPGQDADLSLIPSVSTSVTTDCTTTTAVSMSCAVSALEGVPTNTEQRKTCLFTFNEDTEGVNRENLNTNDIFHTPIELDDISPTKLPLASNQSLDFISPSTSIAEIRNSMNLVQSLGTSTINFVRDTSEIEIQQTNKPNSFGPNFVTRVTEISCFVDKESTADHNYTLGDPLLGGNNEDKNILTTGLSLSNSPEEFQLNESHLEDLSFNENNFIEENGTLEELALFLPCKKEKPDFVCDNIIDEPIPKPEDIQNSLKRLNMLVDISQSGHHKTISIDNTIDHSSSNDCSVSLGIDYAVSKLLFLGGGEVTSQNNFSTIPDIENINIMDTSVLPKQTLEDPSVDTSREEPNILVPVCAQYSTFIPGENQKVVVEPVEQYPITSVDQLKKEYMNDTCKVEEKSEPVVKPNRDTIVKTPPSHKPSKFATFLESVKRDANKNETAKAKDEMENCIVRRHNKTPVWPPKKKTVTQRQHAKSPLRSKKNEVLSFDTNTHNKTQISPEEGRIRVKTDLIKNAELKDHLNNESISSLEYVNEHDHDIASEVVLPFSKPSPSSHKNEVQEKKHETSSKVDTKHARFDKMGKDYIMENILNVHTESAQKSPVQDTKTPDKHVRKVDSADAARKRKLTPTDDVKRDDKRPRKPDDDVKPQPKKADPSTCNIKPTSDDIFDKLLREGPVNKVFAQRITNQTTKKESHANSTIDQLKNKGSTVSDPSRKDRTSQSQSTSAYVHDSSRYKDGRNQKKPGYNTNSGNNPHLDRRYPEKRHISIPVGTSPKRHMRSHPNSYSSKSDPCTTRDYRTRDRRMSTEHRSFPNSSKSELRRDDDEFSWIDKFSGSGLFDTPSGLFMPPGNSN